MKTNAEQIHAEIRKNATRRECKKSSTGDIARLSFEIVLDGKLEMQYWLRGNGEVEASEMEIMEQDNITETYRKARRALQGKGDVKDERKEEYKKYI